MPIIDELERLADLYDAGVLSEAEYRTAKAAIVAEGEGPPSLTRAAERRLAIATIVVAVVIALIGIAAAVLDDGNESDTVAADGTTTTTNRRVRTTVSVTINLPGATTAETFESTTSSSSSTATTAGGATTSTTAVATAGGEAAVKALWAAYKAGDQPAARKVAVKEVVDSLFQIPWSAPDGTFESCAPADSRVRCTYVHKGERITFTADKTPTSPWTVVAISYQKLASTTTTTAATSTSTSAGSTSSSSSSSSSSTATIPFP